MSIYLLHGLTVSALALLIILIRRGRRDIALMSGLAAAPLGLLDALFVLDYWNPPHVLGPLFSIEGMLFSFGNGVLLWVIAEFPFRGRLENSFRYRVFIRHLLIYGAVAMAVIILLWNKTLGLTNLPLMSATILALLVVGAALLIQHPGLLPFSLAGGVGFCLFYTAQLAILSRLSPEFASFWYAGVRDGFTVFSYPIEELAWAMAYGAIWTIVIGAGSGVYLFDSRSPPVGNG